MISLLSKSLPRFYKMRKVAIFVLLGMIKEENFKMIHLTLSAKYMELGMTFLHLELFNKMD